MIPIKSFLLLVLTLNAVIVMPANATDGPIVLYHSDPRVAVVATFNSGQHEWIEHGLSISVPWNFRIVNSFYDEQDRVNGLDIIEFPGVNVVSFKVEGIAEEILLEPKESMELYKNGDNVEVTVKILRPSSDRSQNFPEDLPVLASDALSKTLLIGSLSAAALEEKFRQQGYLELIVAGQSAIRIFPVANDDAITDSPRFTYNPQDLVLPPDMDREKMIHHWFSHFGHLYQDQD